MAKRGKNPAGDLIADDFGGVQVGLLADEDAYDRWTPWRLASWGIGAVGAVTIAVLVSQSYVHKRQDRVAVADLARQTEQIQTLARESRNDIRRLAAAIDTLNGDRDRLFARATALEQGLESVTGSISRQNVAFSSLAASIPPLAVPDRQNTDEKPAPGIPKIAALGSPQSSESEPTSATSAPTIQAVAAIPTPKRSEPQTSAPLPSTDSSPPPSAQGANHETTNSTSDATASVPNEPSTPTVEIAVPRTSFGVDLGAANSLDGLRGLWRRLISTHPSTLSGLHPVVRLREHRGPTGVQLRLIAGPFDNAARAAEVCAAVAAVRHRCTTTTFEGQRLAMDAEPAAAPHPPQRRPNPRHATREKPAATPARTPSTPSTTQSR